jgi:hypothetical protein
VELTVRAEGQARPAGRGRDGARGQPDLFAPDTPAD